jgi:hypothetical protein
MTQATWNKNYMENLTEKTTELLDLAESLDLAIAIRDGVSTSPLMNARQAERFAESTERAISELLDARYRTMTGYEKATEEHAKADEALRAKEQILRGVAAQLPSEWKPTVSGNRIDTEIRASIELEYRYNRDSWKATVTGQKLVVHCNYESRNFPQKKDGTFSINKIIDAIKELSAQSAARITAQAREAQTEKEFRSIAQPFYEYGIYGTSHSWNPSKNFHLKVHALGDGKYAVARTVTEYVTGEQLEAILANEVPKVAKDRV